MNRTVVIVVAILAIAGLDALALSKGHNGALLSSAIGLIAGLAGYVGGLYTQPAASGKTNTEDGRP